MIKQIFPALYLVLSILICSPALAAPPTNDCDPNGETILAANWQQSAGEYTALCYQAYNYARLQLADSLRAYGINKKPAVVMDIDETVLNNIQYLGRRIKHKSPYTDQNWSEWVKSKKASAIPGALEFAKFADKQQVTIYYVTNRNDSDKEATVENLKKLGFPQTDNVMTQSKSEDKRSRFDQINKLYYIIMWIGDSLTDFAGKFDDAPQVKRLALVNQLKSEFGKRFIILPNPVYGGWENSMLGAANLSCKARRAKLVEMLHDY